MSASFSLDFAYAYGAPTASAIFRALNEDFIVHEDLGFDPSGEGEHLLVHIKKMGENTSWVADKLAAYFKVKNMDVSYCGKKDRNAETSQWFSIYLPGQDRDIDWPDFISKSELNAEVLGAARHTRKLRRGAHKANQFRITLRDASDVDDARQRLGKIASAGVPNYFGEQRFGREGSNLDLAARWFEKNEKINNRGKRSMVMSAARSYLFNQVLSARVADGTWRQKLDGDPGSDLDETSGPLWGRGRLKSTEQTLAAEMAVLDSFPRWCDQLEHLGLLQERRALALHATNLQWQVDGHKLIIEFALPPGEYATSLLREVIQLKGAQAEKSP